MQDDFDRWLEHELDRSLAAVTREPAPRRAAQAATRWRPGTFARTLAAAAGAKALLGGAAAVLAAGALAGVAVTDESAPRVHAGGGHAQTPAGHPAATGSPAPSGQDTGNGRGQGNGSGGRPTPANTPNGVSGNGTGNNGQGDRGNSGAAHSPGPSSSPRG